MSEGEKTPHEEERTPAPVTNEPGAVSNDDGAPAAAVAEAGRGAEASPDQLEAAAGTPPGEEARGQVARGQGTDRGRPLDDDRPPRRRGGRRRRRGGRGGRGSTGQGNRGSSTGGQPMSSAAGLGLERPLWQEFGVPPSYWARDAKPAGQGRGGGGGRGHGPRRYLECRTCGVKLERKAAHGSGRVACPVCGNSMTLR